MSNNNTSQASDPATGGKREAVPVPEPVPYRGPVERDKKASEINVVPVVPVQTGGDQIADLLDELTHTIKDHLSLLPMAAEVLSLWALYTHCYPAFKIGPFLTFTSPVPGCGKTTALIMLSHVVRRRALLLSNTSAAAIYRLPVDENFTVLLDELDARAERDDGLRGVINCCHDRRASNVARTALSTKTNDYETTIRSPQFPIALARIGEVFPTWADRSIVVHMSKKGTNEQPTRVRGGDKLGHWSAGVLAVRAE